MQAGALEISLLADVARIKADMDKAVGHITSGAKAMNIAAAGVKAALGGIVAGLSVAAFAGWIRGAIDAADAASKLAQKTGLAVKDVAGMELAFKLAGSSGDAMTMTMARLSKGVVDGNVALAALGIRTKTATGEFRGTKDVLLDVADQFKRLPDGAQKTALAVELFGKAGADLIPLLNSGAEGIREMDAMAAKLGLTLDENTAKQAEQFNDTLDLIAMGSRGVANGIAAQLLPTLTSLAGSFLESMTSGDRLANTAAVLGAGLKLLYSVAVGVVEVFSTVGKTIGAAAGQIIAIFQGDFAGARRIGEEWARDMRSSWSDTAKAISRAWSDEGNAAVTAAATTMAAQKDLLAAAKAREAAGKAAAAAAKKEAEAYAALVAKIGGKSSGTDADFLKNLKLLADGGKKAGLSLAEIMKLQEAYIAQQPYMVAQAKARTKAEEDAKKAVDALYESRMALFKQAEANEQKAQEMLAQFQFEAKLIGLTNEERTVAIALRQLEATGIDKTTEAYQKLRSEIEQQVRANVQAEAGIEAAAKVQKEWERTNQQIADSFVDNLMRGGKNIAQYLKDLFRTLVLRPILAPIGSAVAGVAGAALGMPAAAQGVGGSLVSNAAGSWLGGTMAGGSFLSGVSGASAAMAGGTTFGVTGSIGSIPAAIGTGGTGLAGAAGSMGAGMSAAMAAIPVWGWAAMAALAIATLAQGGETRVGGKYTNTGFIEGPSGGEINAEATRTAIGATMQAINETLRALGATATLTELQSGFEQSKNGKGFAYAGGTLSTGETFGQTHGAGWQNRRGSMTAEEAAAAFGEELQQATLQALQAADVPGLLGEYLRSLGDVDALSGGALDAALGRINQALAEKQALEEQLLTLQSTDLENLTRARERERAALDESNRALYDQIAALSDQKAAAEAAAAAQREIDQERYGLETQLLQLQGNTAELRRRELEALNPTNHALREMIWSLEDAAGAASAAAEAAAAAAAQEAAVMNERAGLEMQLLQLQGNTAEIRRRQLEALDPTNRDLQEMIWWLGDLREQMQRTAEAGAQYKQFLADIAQIIANNLQGGVDRAQQQLGDARNVLMDAYRRESGLLQDVVNKNLRWADSLQAARDALTAGPMSGLSGRQQYLAARGALAGATAETAPALVSQYLDAAQGQSRTAIEYLRHVATGRALLTEQEAIARGAASEAQQQINSMASLVGSVDGLNATIVSFSQALLGARSAQFGLGVAQLNQSTYGMSQASAGALYDEYYRAEAVRRGGSLAEVDHIAEFGGDIQAYLDGLPQYANGTDYVPVTGPAILHQGERVAPAGSARSDGDNAAIVAELRKLNERLERVESAARKTADTLVRVTRDGNSMVTEAA